MRKINYLAITIAILAVLFAGCSEEDGPELFQIQDGGINAYNLPAALNLEYLYSIDNGVTWISESPELEEGANLLVKVMSGSEQLTEQDYYFDWSQSNPVPEDVNSAIASFTVLDSELNIVLDILEYVSVSGQSLFSDYSGEGTLAFEFCTDEGETWSTEDPTKLKPGVLLQVRITDGTNVLTSDEFEFHWSGSTTEPNNPSASIAEFTVGGEGFIVKATIKELDALIVIKRGNGKMFTVDTSNGEMVEVMEITDQTGASAYGLRALDFDRNSGKCYIGGTNDIDANLFSLDISTGVVSMLNDNVDNSRDGISGLLITDDGNVLANIFSNEVSNTAITTFNTTTGEDGTHYELGDNESGGGWSSGGLIYGWTNNELILGSEAEIYFSNLTGIVSDTISLFPTTNIQDPLIMDLARDKNTNEVYALAINTETKYMYLIKIDIVTGVITEIAQLADDNRFSWVHCLAFIPKHRLPKKE